MADRVAPTPLPPALDVAFLTGVAGAAELILVRHGQQEVQPGGPIGDSRDAPLSAHGRVQVELVGRRFASTPLDALYSSGLRRAWDTGAAIGAHHGLTPVVVDDLREIEVFRDLPEDRAPLEVLGRRALLGMRQRMVVEKRWDVYTHSEPSAEFRNRVCNAIEGILAEHPGQRVLIACHGGVIGVYTAWVLGLGADMWFRPGHTAVQVVRAHERVRVVETVGDTSHLVTPRGDLRTW